VLMCCGELGMVGMDRMDSDFDFIFILISFLAQK